MTKIDVRPVKFEGYLDDDLGTFQVEQFDEYTANIRIDCPIDLADWDLIAPRIRECLVSMQLEAGDK